LLFLLSKRYEIWMNLLGWIRVRFPSISNQESDSQLVSMVVLGIFLVLVWTN
jgi:hypothetical protein